MDLGLGVGWVRKHQNAKSVQRQIQQDNNEDNRKNGRAAAPLEVYESTVMEGGTVVAMRQEE